jgi:hypothetical protein
MRPDFSDMRRRLPNQVKTRACALLIGLTVFLPWYESQARIEHDTYLGNPLPYIDWVVLGLALMTAMQPRLGKVLIAFALGSILVTSSMAAYDLSEGLSISIGYGLVAAILLCLAMFVLGRRDVRTGAKSVDSPRLTPT